MSTPEIATLAFAVKCPVCKAPPHQRCNTKMQRGYHIQRADRGVNKENREKYGRG